MSQLANELLDPTCGILNAPSYKRSHEGVRVPAYIEVYFSKLLALRYTKNETDIYVGVK